MKLSRNRGQLYRSLQAMSIFPPLILGLLITVFSYVTVASSLHKEVKTELKNIANSVVLTYNLLYPGDYSIEGTDTKLLFKGNQVISSDFSIIDTIKVDTQVDITVFYQDIRMLTTIRDAEGKRIIGTGVDPKIAKNVLDTGIPHFYSHTQIDEKQYFAYYTPLLNEDGSVVGMIYAGVPSEEVNTIVGYTVLPIILFTIVGILIVSVISSSYTHKLISAIQKISVFLSKVSTGNLWEELDESVLKRNDELSEMGYSAKYMQISLRNLVEQDTLTELNNRRFADKRLKQTQMQAKINGKPFAIAIGDIDFFKSVNDTYGHECGDVVLKQVASLFKRHMEEKGFVARWGGEEFLFVYDNMEAESAKTELQKLLEELRSMALTYDEQTIYVTMTFGVAEGGLHTNIKDLLQKADTKLYEGKANGRNQIVS